jgi:hypothetical protein
MPVELTTIPAVPILRTGTYELSTGTFTFAEEDLRAAVNAWATDPAVKDPRAKIASVEQALDLDPMAHGGEPAFGRFTNLRVSENGQELLADFVGPQAVADAMHWAYPSLSIEGMPRGWTSPTGRSHELAITAVALLGVHWPGITTLQDFTEFLASGPKIEQTAADGEMVLATTRQAPREVVASLDADLIGRRFYDGLDGGEIAGPEGAAAQSLWIRAMRFDDAGVPYLKVTDEASGQLYRVDFKLSGSTVTFGEWAEIVEQDVPVAAGIARPASPLAQWATRDDSRAVRANHEQEGDGMTPEQIRTLAIANGLDPETATEESVMAAVQTAADARAADAGTDPGASGEGEQQTIPVPGETPAPEREAEPVAARTVTVSREQWEETQRTLAALSTEADERRKRETKASRDELVAAAIRDGRITPSERDGWREDLDKHPDGTAAALARLTPGRAVPVGAAVGTDGFEQGGPQDEGTGLFNFENDREV